MTPTSTARDAGEGRRTPRVRQWAVTIVGLSSIALAAWWATHTHLFEARTIRVDGNVHLSRAEVVRLAGIGTRTNVVWMSPGAAEARLEESPWVRAATVSRTLPATLAVRIDERVPVAVVVSDRRSYLVAEDGVVLGTVGNRTALPRVEAVRGGVRIGHRLGPSPGLAVVAALPGPVAGQVRRVEGVERELVLTLRDGTRAVYGDASQAEAKGRALLAVLRWAAQHEVRAAYVDVRVPARPALRPAAGSEDSERSLRIGGGGIAVSDP